MKLFTIYQQQDAIAHSLSGGQSVHTHPFTKSGHPVFRRYSEAAHLFDQDLSRLIETAKSLGVRIIKVEHEGTPKQHIDLCGRPLAKAKELCNLNNPNPYE